MHHRLAHSAEKVAVRRRVLILVPPRRPDSKKWRAHQKADALRAREEAIRSLLSETLDELERVTGFIFPRIEVRITAEPSLNTSLGRILEGLPDAQELRAVADYAATDLSSAKSLTDLNISHLVSISTSTERAQHGWSTPKGIELAHVCTTDNHLAPLITDILLDISMFYSWEPLRTRYVPTFRDRLLLSQRQAAYAIKRCLTSYYGPVRDSSLAYFPFASAVRTGPRLSSSQCEQFERIWRDFVQAEFVNSGLGVADQSLTREAAVDGILTKHVHSGQVSRNGLLRRVRGLAPGRYIYFRIVRPPSGRITKRNLGYLFGTRHLHFGTDTVVQYSSLNAFTRYADYVHGVVFEFDE